MNRTSSMHIEDITEAAISQVEQEAPDMSCVVVLRFLVSYSSAMTEMKRYV